MIFRMDRSWIWGIALWLLASFFIESNIAPTRFQIDVIVDAADTSQLFYSTNGIWSESESASINLIPGWNRITFTLPTVRLGANVRLDPGMRPAVYKVVSATWTRGGIGADVPLSSLTNPRPEASKLHVSDGIATLTVSDNDGQLIVPAPDGAWQISSIACILAVPCLGLLLLVFALRRRSSPVRLSIAFVCIGTASYLLFELLSGLRLPLYDDWRYVMPGQFNIIGNSWQWLAIVANDTYYLTNQLIDFVVLKLSNVSFFWLRVCSLSILVVQIAAQTRLISKTSSNSDYSVAIAIALCVWSLAAGAYWAGATVGYQQALPTLFCTLTIALLMGPNKSFTQRPPFIWIALFCIAGGLAYISGGLMILSLGISLLVVVRKVAQPGARRAAWLITWSGVVLSLIQIVLVAARQGSLLEHNHAVASVYPNDVRFWIFFFAQFGRAVGYTGDSATLDFILTAIILIPAPFLVWQQVARGRSAETTSANAWAALAIYASISAVTYAAIIAFGRSGFSPAGAATASLVVAAKARFHFWPIAAVLPYIWLGWATLSEKLSAGVPIRRLVAVVMLIPKSIIAFSLTSYLISLQDAAKTGAHCVVSHLADPAAQHPMVCTTLTGIAIDIGPTVSQLRDRDASVYRDLIDQGNTN